MYNCIIVTLHMQCSTILRLWNGNWSPPARRGTLQPEEIIKIQVIY